jgi:hypothetical protein
MAKSNKTLFTLRDGQTGESQTVVACKRHAEGMPLVDGYLISASPCDDDIACEFCHVEDENAQVS